MTAPPPIRSLVRLLSHKHGGQNPANFFRSAQPRNNQHGGTGISLGSVSATNGFQCRTGSPREESRPSRKAHLRKCTGAGGGLLKAGNRPEDQMLEQIARDRFHRGTQGWRLRTPTLSKCAAALLVRVGESGLGLRLPKGEVFGWVATVSRSSFDRPIQDRTKERLHACRDPARTSRNRNAWFRTSNTSPCGPEPVQPLSQWALPPPGPSGYPVRSSDFVTNKAANDAAARGGEPGGD